MHKIAEEIIEAILLEKDKEIATTERARKMSVDDACEAEGAMISRYDTFLEEAQYLAGAQSKRLIEARDVVEIFKKALTTKIELNKEPSVNIGDIFVVQNIDTEEKRYFLIVVEGAGGKTYDSEIIGMKVTAITINTPIGTLLAMGEECDFSLPGTSGTWEVIDIL